jgi:hypothetical protein
MVEACIDYGIPGELINKKMFLVQKMMGIGEPPMRVEILQEPDAIDFKYTFQRVKKVRVDGFLVNVLDLDDFILLRKATV